MANLDTYTGRVTFCLGLIALDEGVPRVLVEDLAARIEKARGKLYPGPTVGRWLKRWPGDVDDMLALASVLKADPGWLYFGPRHSDAPAPLPLSALTAAEQAAIELPQDQHRRRA